MNFIFERQFRYFFLLRRINIARCSEIYCRKNAIRNRNERNNSSFSILRFRRKINFQIVFIKRNQSEQRRSEFRKREIDQITGEQSFQLAAVRRCIDDDYGCAAKNGNIRSIEILNFHRWTNAALRHGNTRFSVPCATRCSVDCVHFRNERNNKNEFIVLPRDQQMRSDRHVRITSAKHRKMCC